MRVGDGLVLNLESFLGKSFAAQRTKLGLPSGVIHVLPERDDQVAEHMYVMQLAYAVSYRIFLLKQSKRTTVPF